MRLGAPIYGDTSEPGKWVELVRKMGYRAAYCPVNTTTQDDIVRAYADAAREADIVIAEVGAWSNPLSPNEEERRKALTHCQESLALAERIGARCCVNIVGSRGEQWDGPHPDNLTEETFERIVATTREIIDAVQPTRTYYTLETMPWMYPDSVESYLRLIQAIDRPAFAVHLDPVNLICSPQRYFGNADLIRDCFAQLGPWIKSVHAKDITLSTRLTVHLDEVRPGLGGLDYRTFLTEMNRLDPDTPFMLEHLPKEEEYIASAAYVRAIASELGFSQ
jgi:sugar phosphate isomerase/epimerase